jgi:hypothetical protein
LKPYTLDEVHADIHTIYRWWAEKAPGVTPVEENELGALWALADRLVEDQRTTLTPEQFSHEFGRGN